MDSKSIQRLIIGLFTLSWCFGLILLDAKGLIDIGKFGYAGIGSWMTLIIQFYFRKAGSNGEPKPS